MDEPAAPAAENPYAAPESDVDTGAERKAFPELTTREVKKLRNDSHSIRSTAFLLALATGLILLGLLAGGIGAVAGASLPEFAMAGGALAFSATAATGLFLRRSWGRILGFIVGALLILTFSIATLVGLLLLVALARAKPLFGPGRLLHRELEAEWKYRRRNRIE